MHHHHLSQVVSSALLNPYSQYALHSSSPSLSAAPGGYSFSSTYNPASTSQLSSPVLKHNQQTVHHKHSSTSTWYQYGNVKCTYRDCSFTGSPKSVEIHMMDRHLIYPPGWEKQKQRQKSEWDADPSLKGKNIPIQGTNILLNTPEALEAWIAERKKRWPTTERVAEKKRKLEEAIERGQIVPFDSSFVKRHCRRDEQMNTMCPENRARSQRSKSHKGWRNNGCKQGRIKGGAGISTHSVKKEPVLIKNVKIILPSQGSEHESSSSSDDDDSPPEIASSKTPKAPTNSVGDVLVNQEPKTYDKGKNPEVASASRVEKRNNRPERKNILHNPFGSKPPLLHNLLLPEIRITISNLSQAIHFLVENDFLFGVELTPGEADHQMIQELE
ncbi:hypothetical protein AMATHDRAFT_72334 [Amanita thiersii Skay4041]|uniref:FMR1-interacting protein 1 conserved domain-containing protein n=1 Tax=Amanita thiersii Skay4041 TaxID=703135 RepID=A0A2A9NWL4_9AGAR|nr:hypothetical protein AMATHDRAFT_72334 [Amanita thiersii Skay4041]